MDAQSVKLTQEKDDRGTDDILCIELKTLRAAYAYIGFWYACDKNEDTSITTELYYGESEAGRPAEKSEEISENSFKKTPRIALSRKADSLWMKTRVEERRFCKMKLYPASEERSFINYKVIRPKGSTYDTLKTGVIKGDTARFYKLGIEDGSGAVDYNDTIFFLVCIKTLPPADWKFDPSFFGVEKLPIVVPTVFFSHRGSYSRWLGQEICAGIP